MYVGMSGLTPEQRFENHQVGDKASSVVRRYGRRLLPELHAHLNPMPFEAAVEMEHDLAEDRNGMCQSVAWQSDRMRYAARSPRGGWCPAGKLIERRRAPNECTLSAATGAWEPMSDVTQILRAIKAGDNGGAEQLLAVVYAELKRIAAQKMAGEAQGHTLQPTALVHEAWMKLVGDGDPAFENRAHFFASAAEAMRRILVDSARRKKALRRGGGAARETLEEDHLVQDERSDELLAVDEALDLLAREDPVAADLVKLRYFVGMTMEEAAATMGMSLRNTERAWTYARAWLRRRIGEPFGPPERTY